MVVSKAMVTVTATVGTGGRMAAMEPDEVPRKSDAVERERSAESRLADIFKKAGWQVRSQSSDGTAGP